MSNSHGLAPKGFGFNSDNPSSNNFELNIPVLLLTFKRLNETKKSFEQIKKAKPKKLYIAGDGPRKDKPDEKEKVSKTREYILNNINWECDVKTLLRDENLGCRKSNSLAIEWLFTHEEMGIIIEDDVVVSQDFFRFAQELLYKHKDNTQIMCITADNFQNGNKYNNDSYYFSQIPHCWGWASWKSSWEKYKEVEKKIPELVENIKQGKIPQFTHNEVANYMWAHNLMQTYSKNVDSWAYIWTLANLYFGGFTCTPSVNLAQHIGYGEDSTHIKQPVEFALQNIETIHFPLSHPQEVKCLEKADNFAYKRVFFIDRFNDFVKQDNIDINSNKIPKPIFNENLSPIKSIYAPENTIRECQNLFNKYLRSPRYQETTINFLDYSFNLPDAQSFIWQFKDIFEQENYKFQPKTNNPVIIDCGANVGTSCLYFSKTYPNSHIFAFEPDKKIFSYLEKNIKNNNINNITLFNSAVWIKDGELEFASEGADGGTLLLSNNNMIKVDAISLNDFLSKFEYIDFLKIDIEGVEDIVLKNCISNLHKIENLFIEYHSFYAKKQNYDEILKILTENNFRYYTTTANHIQKPFFNKTKYGTMDLQINIYAAKEIPAATLISQSSPENKVFSTNEKKELQIRKESFTNLINSTANLKLLNLGCGANFHPEWTNIDFTSTGQGVKAYNLLNGIPEKDNSFDFIYHSHVLEHFPKNKAQDFINECFRVLKPNGLIRIAIPDLEKIAELYLEKLNKAINGDTSAANDYDWMMLELLDQTVRNQSGGEMQKYLGMDNITNMNFIRERIGIYAESIRQSCLNAMKNPNYIKSQEISNSNEDYLKIGAFRMGGEIHQWMYDRFSLTRILNNAGFKHIGIVSAYESSFDNFSNYNLDVKNGKIVKTDSLFVEAIKPDPNENQVNTKNSQSESKTKSNIFLNNGGIKVLTLSSKDSGGAGGAARRMHEAALKAGADSVMIVLDKATNSERVAELEIPIPNLDRSQPSAQLFYAFNLIQKKLTNYPKRNIPSMFTSTESIVNFTGLSSIFNEADIIHIHWIDGFFDYNNAPSVLKNKKIVWTLHDMYQFTGGCHYALDCTNYKDDCQTCPQLGKPSNCIFTQECMRIKENAYSQLEINIVTPSKWLKNCASQSKLMKDFSCDVIPNTFDITKFKQIDMNDAREKFKISQNKCVILFGADHILNPVKNISSVLKGLTTLCESNKINSNDFVLVLFGAGQIPSENYPFNIQNIGKINSAEDMAYIYSSADFLMLPSIADNYPNIMCESLACGTPVVGFDIGGLPDLISSEITGYLAKPFNLEDLQNGILWGINTAKGNNDIRKKCRKIVEENLSEEIIGAKIVSYYKEVLNRSSRTIEHKPNSNIQTLYSINSNDPLRKQFIETIKNTEEKNLSEVANNFTNDISNWLITKLLPHRNLTDEETKLKEECLKALTSINSDNNEYLQALLLSIMLIPAEELPLTIDIYKQPDSIKDILTQYIFSFKELPAYSGFAEITLKHMISYLQMLKKECNKNTSNAVNLILNAFNTLRKLPVYCANGGLKEVMVLFADIMHELLTRNNAAINYEFNERDKKAKIKLGVLLQAFGEHTETYATLPTFTHLSKDEYEIFVFVLKITNSSQEIQYKDCYDHLIEISPTQIPQSVNKIREADLDILLIGTNITALANHNALICSHRLARIQAVHFCNPCTTGIKNIDYFITGKYFSLDQNDFTEKLIYNKNSGICFEGNTIVKPASLQLSKKDLGISENTIAFVTGANYYKFTWELREFWAKLLKQIPNSCLITFPFGPAWTNQYPVNEFNLSIQDQFTSLDVDSSRLIILKPLPTREDVRQVVGLCDIYLDSFPYSGATSLLDPLNTNTPVVCMKTNSIRGGQGCGMLEDIGLNELIVSNKAEYIQLATKLANDVDYRNKMSETIHKKMIENPVFSDTRGFCQDMDRIYKTMLIEYDKGISTITNQDSNETKINDKKLKPNDPCSCGSGLKYKKCCGKNL